MAKQNVFLCSIKIQLGSLYGEILTFKMFFIDRIKAHDVDAHKVLNDASIKQHLIYPLIF